jgi:hypothetical protein
MNGRVDPIDEWSYFSTVVVWRTSGSSNTRPWYESRAEGQRFHLYVSQTSIGRVEYGARRAQKPLQHMVLFKNARMVPPPHSDNVVPAVPTVRVVFLAAPPPRLVPGGRFSGLVRVDDQHIAIGCFMGDENIHPAWTTRTSTLCRWTSNSFHIAKGSGGREHPPYKDD